jgi:hypothetical protein
MKGWIVVGLAVAGTGFAALVGLGTFFVHAENVEARYATYAEAEDDSAVDRGWIPPFVPRSAVRIREFHNLDTNRQWLRFEAPRADLDQMTSPMRSMSYEEAERLGFAGFPGWTGSRRSKVRPPEAEVRFYYDPSPGSGARCVAVVPEPATAFAWTCR